MKEFEQHDKRKAEYVAQLKAMPIEEQMLMFCIRPEDLLVPPAEYLDKLYTAETFEDRVQLKAMEKPKHQES